jgi:plastocyanin
MKRNNLLMCFLLVASLLIIALPLAGCAGSGSAAGTTAAIETTAAAATTATTAPVAGGLAVTIESFAFNPDSLTIKVGDTVTWTNKDSVGHTITEDKGAFDSGSINNGATFSFTFKTAGTFSYHCTVHPNMTAKIIVQ